MANAEHTVVIPVTYNLVINLDTVGTDMLQSLIEWDADDLATLPLGGAK